MAGRFRELMKKYGKVALGVHLSVSTVSITGLYVAIRNNVDVEAILEKLHMGTVSEEQNPNPNPSDDVAAPPKNRTAQLAASAGGAFTLAILCNKALFPVRVPITVALTPPIARFLARRKIIKTGLWIGFGEENREIIFIYLVALLGFVSMEVELQEGFCFVKNWFFCLIKVMVYAWPHFLLFGEN